MGSNRKKKKKKKNLHAHTFSHRDPCAMIFYECKKLAVLDCEEQHLLSFSSKLCFISSDELLMLDSRVKYPTLPSFWVHF